MSDTPQDQSSPVGRLSYRAAVLSVAALAVLYARYAWFVCQRPPHQDDWAILDGMFDALDRGGMAARLFARHNGHILIPARLAFLAAYQFSHLDLSWVRGLCAVVAGVSAFLWCRWLQRNLGGDPALPGLVIGGALVIFSLCYWECFSIGIGFSAYLAALLACAGFAFLARGSPDWKPGGVSLLGALGCFGSTALTFGSGYAAAIAAACWLTAVRLSEKLPANFRLSPAVCRIAPLVLGLVLLLGLPSASWPRSPLLEFAFRYCLCVGAFASQALPKASISLHDLLAFGAGLLLVCASVWQLLLFFGSRGTDPGCRWGSGLLFCGLFTCLSVAYSRLPLSPEEMLSSRYSLHFAPGLLGLLLCLRNNRFIFLGFLATFAVFTVLASRQELRVAPYRQVNYGHLEAAMLKLPEMSDAEIQQAFYWPGAKEIRRVTLKMADERLGVFHSVTKP